MGHCVDNVVSRRRKAHLEHQACRDTPTPHHSHHPHHPLALPQRRQIPCSQGHTRPALPDKHKECRGTPIPHHPHHAHLPLGLPQRRQTQSSQIIGVQRRTRTAPPAPRAPPAPAPALQINRRGGGGGGGVHKKNQTGGLSGQGRWVGGKADERQRAAHRAVKCQKPTLVCLSPHAHYPTPNSPPSQHPPPPTSSPLLPPPTSLLSFSYRTKPTVRQIMCLP